MHFAYYTHHTIHKKHSNAKPYFFINLLIFIKIAYKYCHDNYNASYNPQHRDFLTQKRNTPYIRNQHSACHQENGIHRHIAILHNFKSRQKICKIKNKHSRRHQERIPRKTYPESAYKIKGCNRKYSCK